MIKWIIGLLALLAPLHGVSRVVHRTPALSRAYGAYAAPVVTGGAYYYPSDPYYPQDQYPYPDQQ